ncbi:MAG: hypothetical protein RJB04_352 [Verrucomicrobiota bacterium]
MLSSMLPRSTYTLRSVELNPFTNFNIFDAPKSMGLKIGQSQPRPTQQQTQERPDGMTHRIHRVQSHHWLRLKRLMAFPRLSSSQQ